MIPFIPNTKQDQKVMLDALGMGSLDELFLSVPEKYRRPKLDLPPSLSEPEILSEMSRLADRNAAGSAWALFAGAGAYRHFVPSAVDAIVSRGEFLTSYTPYQPEASQGTLQALFEYQSMIAELFGMDTVNASHYDGATALAEAVLMAYRAHREERKTVVLSSALHPEYRSVIETYCRAYGISFRGPSEDAWKPEDLGKLIDEKASCVVVSFPTFYGDLADYRRLCAEAHEKKALFIVSADPHSLALFDPPGSYGADIVTGEGQSLGSRLSFGGPCLGLFAVKKELVRKMPGRLAGMTRDAEDRCGFVLTLNTREQHIRREKAVSNICTNQGLVALRAAVYLSLLGKNGLRKAAELSYAKARYAADTIAAIPGFKVLNGGPFFREFTVSCPLPAGLIVQRLAPQKVLPGVALSRYFPDRPNDLLVSVTEMNPKAEIDRLAAALQWAADDAPANTAAGPRSAAAPSAGTAAPHGTSDPRGGTAPHGTSDPRGGTAVPLNGAAAVRDGAAGEKE